jgi:hypothetical protein
LHEYFVENTSDSIIDPILAEADLVANIDRTALRDIGPNGETATRERVHLAMLLAQRDAIMQAVDSRSKKLDFSGRLRVDRGEVSDSALKLVEPLASAVAQAVAAVDNVLRGRAQLQGGQQGVRLFGLLPGNRDLFPAERLSFTPIISLDRRPQPPAKDVVIRPETGVGMRITISDGLHEPTLEVHAQGNCVRGPEPFNPLQQKLVIDDMVGGRVLVTSDLPVDVTIDGGTATSYRLEGRYGKVELTDMTRCTVAVNDGEVAEVTIADTIGCGIAVGGTVGRVTSTNDVSDIRVEARRRDGTETPTEKRVALPSVGGMAL